MLKAHGNERSKKLKIVLAALRAAPNLGVFSPPYSPPHRCHELKGKKKGELSFDLDGPYRLVLKPIDEPLPRNEDGDLDWSLVNAIEIKGVEDTHG